MPLSESEKRSLLAEKGIGTTILKRLEEMGLDDVKILAVTSLILFFKEVPKSRGQPVGAIAHKPETLLKPQ